MKKIVITGGFGFLGSYLVKKIISLNYKVVIIEKSFASNYRIIDELDTVDLYYEDKDDIRRIFDNNDIIGIIHAATDYGRSSSLSEIINSNILFPISLLEYSNCDKLNFFINIDSYFNKDHFSLDYLGNYTTTKKHLVDWLKLSDGFRIYNLKLEHIYGPHDGPMKFVTQISNSLKSNAKELDLTEGDQERDFIFIDDVIDLITELITINNQMDRKFFDIEVGTGISTSVKHFVLLAKKVFNNDITSLNFGKIKTREHEINISKADLTKLPIESHWKPKITLVEGLRLLR